MPRKVVYQAAVEYLQILDEEGRLDEELAQGTLDRRRGEGPLRARWSSAASSTRRRSSSSGPAGWARSRRTRGRRRPPSAPPRRCARASTTSSPTTAKTPALFLHGLPMHYVLLHWMGDERGNAVPRNLSMNPLCVAIGTQTLHAVGIAWAFKLRKEDRVGPLLLRRRRHQHRRLSRGDELRRGDEGARASSAASTTAGPSRSPCCRQTALARRSPRRRWPTACRRCRWTATTSSPSTRPTAKRSNAPGRRRPVVHRGADVPPGRPHHRRRRPPLPPGRRTGSGDQAATRSCGRGSISNPRDSGTSEDRIAEREQRAKAIVHEVVAGGAGHREAGGDRHVRLHVRRAAGRAAAPEANDADRLDRPGPDQIGLRAAECEPSPWRPETTVRNPTASACRCRRTLAA